MRQVSEIEYQGPSIGDTLLAMTGEDIKLAPPVRSIAEIQRDRALQYGEVMRHYSLTVMLRKAGIRRSISRQCACGKTISANKTHCAACKE